MSQDATTKLLHDFLQMTDNIPPQVFFAYTAMLAVKQAQNQMAIPLEALRSQNAALTVHVAEQQEHIQQLSAQYKTLIKQQAKLALEVTLNKMKEDAERVKLELDAYDRKVQQEETLRKLEYQRELDSMRQRNADIDGRLA